MGDLVKMVSKMEMSTVGLDVTKGVIMGLF